MNTDIATKNLVIAYLEKEAEQLKPYAAEIFMEMQTREANISALDNAMKRAVAGYALLGSAAKWLSEPTAEGGV